MKIMKLYEIIGNMLHSGKHIYYKKTKGSFEF